MVATGAVFAEDVGRISFLPGSRWGRRSESIPAANALVTPNPPHQVDGKEDAPFDWEERETT